MKYVRTPNQRRLTLGIIGVILALVMAMLTPVSASAGGDHKNEAPRARIQQDGPMVEVVFSARQARGVERLAFRLTGVGTDVLVEGETGPPQIKLVLAFDETYDFSFRALRHDKGWSDWSEPVRLTAPAIDAYPFSITATAIDGGIALGWADTEADSYRIDVRDAHRRRVARLDISGTDTVIDGLTNGQTYKVTIRARYGERLTNRSPAIPVTPNDGTTVTVQGRDYVTEPLDGPTDLTVRTAVTGATDRIGKVQVRVVPEGLRGRKVTARFDPSATATSGIDGAWVTPALSISPFDHELITLVKSNRVEGRRIVLASSMQTWLLGNVDAFAPRATQFTRVGTIR